MSNKNKTSKKKNLGDYAAREEIAISAGKAQIPPVLTDRHISKKGFFAVLTKNDLVHPEYYKVNTADGIGTKIFFMPWLNNFAKQMQDGIAMNANDLAPLINAWVDTVTLYFACQSKVEEEKMGEIMKGTVDALILCDPMISIKDFNKNIEAIHPNLGKIETASLDEMIGGPVPNYGFDVGVSMTGWIRKEDMPNLNPQPGYYIVGFKSSGLHSNNYTDGRHFLLNPNVESRPEWKKEYKGRFNLDDKPSILKGKTIGEALTEPTLIYLEDVLEIGRLYRAMNVGGGKDIYGVNITGNGFKNFNRAGENVSFNITDPFERNPIDLLLQQEAGYSNEKTYTKMNCNLGFAVIVDDLNRTEDIVKLVNGLPTKTEAKIIGEVAKYKDKTPCTNIHIKGKKKPIHLEGY